MVGIITTIAVVISNQESKSQDEENSTDSGQNMSQITNDGRPERKSPSLNGQKSTLTPKFLGKAKAYFVFHIGLNFQISLIYAFIKCL